MRALSFSIWLPTWTIASSLLLGQVAHAQQVYNVDGTPAMIRPDGTFADGNEIAPGNVPAASAQGFDADCDPDVDNCTDPNAQAYDDGYDPSAYQQFEGALDPYGSWVDDPTYGRVWVPSPDVVGSDFEPYETGGQWVASNDYGFTWVSDYDWGWAPFHYGRWACLNGSSWGWIPGSIWGPAWVSWRYGGGYVGWAPMAPRGVVVPPPHSLGTRNAWRFALANELFHRNPTLLPAHVAATVWARTAPANNARTIGYGAVNARVNLGPSLSTLARDLGHPIPALGLRNTAPSVLPRAHVVARAGVALTQRPYLRPGAPTAAGVTRVSAMPPRGVASAPLSSPSPYRYGPTVPSPAAASAYPRPIYRGPAQNYPQPAYRGPTQPYSPAYRAPAQAYSPPAYRAPTQAYSPPAYSSPAYRAPTQAYSPPAYRAPTQTYAPAYHAPAATYSAPAYHPAAAPAVSRPAFSAPSFGGGGHHHR